MIKKRIAEIINEICDEKKYILVDANQENFRELKLRDDIGFDSFDLAQLTVLIEEEFDVDIFEDGIVETIGEIVEKLK